MFYGFGYTVPIGYGKVKIDCWEFVKKKVRLEKDILQG